MISFPTAFLITSHLLKSKIIVCPILSVFTWPVPSFLVFCCWHGSVEICWHDNWALQFGIHYNDVILSAMTSQITSLKIVYSTVCSDADQRNIKAPRHWLCDGNSPVTGEFPAQKATNAENVSIWWRHHAFEWVTFSCHWYRTSVPEAGIKVRDKYNYISQYVWDVITCPYPWYLLLANESSIKVFLTHYDLVTPYSVAQLSPPSVLCADLVTIGDTTMHNLVTIGIMRRLSHHRWHNYAQLSHHRYYAPNHYWTNNNILSIGCTCKFQWNLNENKAILLLKMPSAYCQSCCLGIDMLKVSLLWMFDQTSSTFLVLFCFCCCS